MKALLALGIVILFGFIGFKISDPVYDAAARSLCSTYAVDRGLELIEARGSAAGRLAFQDFPNYPCSFVDRDGSPVLVDENDGLIEPTWEYRGLRVGGGSRGRSV